MLPTQRVVMMSQKCKALLLQHDFVVSSCNHSGRNYEWLPQTLKKILIFQQPFLIHSIQVCKVDLQYTCVKQTRSYFVSSFSLNMYSSSHTIYKKFIYSLCTWFWVVPDFDCQLPYSYIWWKILLKFCLTLPRSNMLLQCLKVCVNI